MQGVRAFDGLSGFNVPEPAELEAPRGGAERGGDGSLQGLVAGPLQRCLQEARLAVDHGVQLRETGTGLHLPEDKWAELEVSLDLSRLGHNMAGELPPHRQPPRRCWRTPRHSFAQRTSAR